MQSPCCKYKINTTKCLHNMIVKFLSTIIYFALFLLSLSLMDGLFFWLSVLWRIHTNAVVRCHFVWSELIESVKFFTYISHMMHDVVVDHMIAMSSRKRSLKIKMYLDNCVYAFLFLGWEAHECWCAVCNKQKSQKKRIEFIECKYIHARAQIENEPHTYNTLRECFYF